MTKFAKRVYLFFTIWLRPFTTDERGRGIWMPPWTAWDVAGGLAKL